jgi:hypothetical protein
VLVPLYEGELTIVKSYDRCGRLLRRLRRRKIIRELEQRREVVVHDFAGGALTNTGGNRQKRWSGRDG